MALYEDKIYMEFVEVDKIYNFLSPTFRLKSFWYQNNGYNTQILKCRFGNCIDYFSIVEDHIETYNFCNFNSVRVHCSCENVMVFFKIGYTGMGLSADSITSKGTFRRLNWLQPFQMVIYVYICIFFVSATILQNTKI